MGNFALQKGPCNFLKLRISPWGNPFLLLFSLFFFYLAFSFIRWRLHLFLSLSLSLVYPLLHRLGLQANRGAGRRLGALLPRAAAAHGGRRAGSYGSGRTASGSVRGRLGARASEGAQASGAARLGQRASGSSQARGARLEGARGSGSAQLRWRRWRGAEQRSQRARQLGAAGDAEPAAPGGMRERASAGPARASGHWSGSRAVQEQNVGGAERVAQACARWRAELAVCAGVGRPE
jgi:hypothetical protein